MSRPFSLERIPKAIREELLARQADQPGLSLNEQAAWLFHQGYKVSRSAVFRYLASKKEPEPESAVIEGEEDERSVRLGCLMVAASYSLPGDKTDLLRTATELVKWVEAPPQN